MAPPMYKSKEAMGKILGVGQSPEGIELLTQQIPPPAQAGTGQGAPNPMMEQGIAGARSRPGAQGAIQSAPEKRYPSGPPPPSPNLWDLDGATWLDMHWDQDVPWQEGLTFGEYLDKIRKDHGTDAMVLAIEELQAIQKERAEERPPSFGMPPPQPKPSLGLPSAPMQTLPQAPAPGGQQVQQQVQQPPGQPIMAHGGGFVHQGTIAGELAPKGIMSAREAGETLHELRKRYEDEQTYRRYNSVGIS
jgi:hypothetical protein